MAEDRWLRCKETTVVRRDVAGNGFCHISLKSCLPLLLPGKLQCVQTDTTLTLDLKKAPPSARERAEHVKEKRKPMVSDT